MRYLCEVLDEIRNCYKTYNFSPILGLVEEAQTMGNRTESALGEKKSYFYWKDAQAEAKKEVEKLNKQLDDIKDKIEKKEIRDDD